MIRRTTTIVMIIFVISINCTMGQFQTIKPFTIEELQKDGVLEFEFRILIKRSHESVFQFFRDIDKHPQEKDSPVLLLEKITDGPPQVGTQYVEIVKMLPFIKGRFISEITHYEPNNQLEMMWIGGGMKGYIIYYFESFGANTQLTQVELIKPVGIFSLFNSSIKRIFSENASNRLKHIKTILESEESKNGNINSF